MNRRGERANQIRVIAGQWRGRRLRFPDAPGLRPTPDRVRETLFNWLAPVLPGSRCLDLFAGSGALGIEALSRGAAEAVFVESQPAAVAALRENLARLDARGVRVEKADALAWLSQPGTPFEIVLLDPPFGEGLLEPVCAMLERGEWLAPTAWIYLEAETELRALSLPARWTPYREKTAGAVTYRLVRRDISPFAPDLPSTGGRGGRTVALPCGFPDNPPNYPHRQELPCPSSPFTPARSIPSPTAMPIWWSAAPACSSG